MTKFQQLLLGGTVLICISYLAGTDAALNRKEQASRADRIRIYCAMHGVNETLCEGK